MIQRRLLSVLALGAVLTAGARAQLAPELVEPKVVAGLARLTLDEKIALIGGVDGFYIREIPKLGLPRIKMSDGPVGVRNYGKTTAYPATLALAASFDPALAYRYGEAIGRDARARGVHILLAPGVNLARVPQNGRNFEYMGEDPLVASRLAVGYIRGVQAQGVSATIKHFVGNEHENDRNRDSSEIAERPLRELYLRPFEAAVSEGRVQCVMSSYNLFRGAYTTANPYLVREILKGEFGFRGIYMSDWGAAHETLGTVRDGLDLEMPGPEFMNEAAIRPLLAAGRVTEAQIDDKIRRILRVIYTMEWDRRPQEVAAIPKADPASEAAALDVARSGTVLLKNAGGLLPLGPRARRILVVGPNATPAVTGGGGSSYTDPTTAVSLADAIRAAAPAGAEIAVRRGVADPGLAFDAPGFDDGFAVEWWTNRDLEGAPARAERAAKIDADWGDGAPEGLPRDRFSARWTGEYTPRVSGAHTLAARSDDGIRVTVDGKVVVDAWRNRGAETDVAKLDLVRGRKVRVTVEYYEDAGNAEARFGIAPDSALGGDLSDAELGRADVVVYAGGLSSSSEGEGFDRAFELPTVQRDLLARVVRRNRNVVIVNNSGGPVDLAPFERGARAILQAWYPGGNGNAAVAEILFGKTNPSGKLPLSWPRTLKGTYYERAYPSKGRRMVYDEGLLMGYRWFDARRAAPLFPFGHGLSYTTFALSGLRIESGKDGLQAVVAVRNTGRRAGAETVQLYMGDARREAGRPVRELKAFERVELAPGESKTVSLAVPRKWLARWEAGRGWTVPSGDQIFSVGTSSRDLPLTARYVWR